VYKHCLISGKNCSFHAKYSKFLWFYGISSGLFTIVQKISAKK
jgi:hypothetical protein